ncbi:MAG TPA: phage tail tape measure protein [Selenomonadales bacterium]|nr:phage tail tape measure protein [Selenomonadales bacterium]
MDIDNNNIKFEIIVNTNTSEKNITTLKQDIAALQAAIEKASKMNLDIKIDGFRKNIEEARELQNSLIGKLEQLNTNRIDIANKTANAEAQAAQKAAEAKVRAEEKAYEQITNLKAKQNAETNRQYWIDEENARKKRTEQLKEQMNNVPVNFIPYQQELGNIRKQQEQLHQEFVKGNIQVEQYKNKMASLNTAYQSVSNQAKEFSGVVSRTNSYLGSFPQKLRSHFNWLFAGSLLAGAITIPVEIADRIKQVEQAMASMKQVLPELHESMEAYNKETMTMINLAAIYGEKTEDIIKAATLWGRMYKDQAIVNTLTHQSAIVAVADNMSLVEANKALEAAMFQYGLVAENAAEAQAYSNKIIDVWTKLAHNAGVAAIDLANGVERAGSVAKLTGVDFEFLNAMIATAVRSTGRSGAEIGNMIKSVLGSFHSDKAVKEIEAMGVAVKTIGQDGTINFRKAQDVLLDLSLAAQGTDKNLENLFKQIAGGKFQWAKAAAMLGDYKEFIRTWGEAVNSQGFSAEQVGMQLDTLSRRIGKLKTDIDGLFIATGQSGLTQFLKEQVSAMDNVILGLRQIPAEGWKMMGWAAEAAIAISTLSRVTTGLQTALLAARAEATAFSMAMAFIQRIPVVAMFTAIALAVGLVAEKLGEAANKSRDQAAALKDTYAAEQQRLNMQEQQVQYINALATAHDRMKQQLESSSLSEKKAIKIKENMIATEDQLSKVFDASAIERIKAADYSIEAINKEKDEQIKANNQKRQDLSIMLQQQIDAASNEITALEKQINAYWQDAAHFGESIQSKLKWLGIWQTALLTMQEWNTAGLERGQKSMQTQLDNYVANGGTDQNTIETYQKRIAELEEAAQESREAGQNIVNSPVRELQIGINEARGKIINLEKTYIDYNPITVGGSQYDSLENKKGKNKGDAYANPPNTAEYRKRIEIQAEYKKLLADMQISTNRYSEALDDLNTKESILGLTVGVVNKKYELSIQRIKELQTEQSKLTTERDKYQTLLDDYLAKDQEFQSAAANTIPNWFGMSKGERKDYLVTNREGMQEFRTLKTLLDTISELDVKIAETSKNTSKLQNQWSKDFLGDALNPDKQRERRLKSIGIDESIDKTRINKRNPFWEQEEIDVELNAEKRRYEEYKEQAKKLNDEYEKLAITEVEAAEKQMKLAEKMQEGEEKAKALAEAIRVLEAARRGDTKTIQENIDKQRENNKKMEESQKQQVDLAKKTALEIRRYQANLLADFIVEGNSFRDVWKSIWKSIQKDAIGAMFKTEREFSGATKMLGKGGRPSGVSGPTFEGGNFYKNGKGGGGKHATGGVVNAPTLLNTRGDIAGEDGEETIIVPNEKNTQKSKGLLDYAASRLGYYPGENKGNYVPYFKNPELATQPIVNVQLQQQNNHIKELERQTKVMTAMMNHMMNNSDGNTTVVPLVTQISSEQVLKVLRDNPDALNNILGYHRNQGYR